MSTPVRLPEEIVHPAPAPAPTVLRTLASIEQEHVLAVLRACHGVQATAARILGIGRNTLWRKLRAYGEASAGDVPGAPRSRPGSGSRRAP